MLFVFRMGAIWILIERDYSSPVSHDELGAQCGGFE
jgi:hypothetical protein